MKLREIFEAAKANGRWSEKQMWQSIDAMDDMLADMKKTDKQAFWDFMREQYGIASGGHYDEAWAMHDVSEMYSTNKEGKKWQGAYWTVEQIEEATKDKTFPSGTTKWDKFVAYNAAKHDFCKSFDDAHILNIAYDFYFADEDFKGGNKIWCYMAMVYDKD